MTRIVAGHAKGRRLTVPATGTRPTSDRAREAVFSALDSRMGGFAGVGVLDLYAGSGALGLEAASRGAGSVDFVESDRRAVEVLRKNIAAVDATRAQVHAQPVERWVLAGHLAHQMGLVFVDPPYAVANDDVAEVLTQLAAAQVLAVGAWVVVERGRRAGNFPWPRAFEAEFDRRYGEATMWFGRFGSVTAC